MIAISVYRHILEQFHVIWLSILHKHYQRSYVEKYINGMKTYRRYTLYIFWVRYSHPQSTFFEKSNNKYKFEGKT